MNMEKYFIKMNNSLKKIGMGTLCAFAAISLVACDDKEDDPDNNEGGGSGSGNSQVASAVLNFGGDVLSYVGDNEIYYDQKGRVESIYGHYDEYLEIDYSRGTIDIAGDKANIKFNSNGYISELSSSWDYREDDYRYTGDGKFEFSYNSSGNLINLNYTGSETGRNSSTKETYTWEGNTTITLNWSDGNLTSTTWKTVDKEDGERDTWNGKYNITYGSEKNVFGQIPFTVSDYAIFDDCLLNALASTGLFGKGPKNLPTSLDEIDEGLYDYSVYMDFFLNRNGSIDTEYEDYSSYDYGYTSLSSRSKSNKIKTKTWDAKKTFGRHLINHRNKKPLNEKPAN